MNDRDTKTRKLLEEFAQEERYPPFKNLWSLAQTKTVKGRHWRWVLGPSVATAFLVPLLIFLARPMEPGQSAHEQLAGLEDLQVSQGMLDTMLTEPTWLTDGEGSGTVADESDDAAEAITLVLGDTPYKGTTGFLLQWEIPDWDTPVERTQP